MKKIFALIVCVLICSISIGSLFTVSAEAKTLDAIRAVTAPTIDGEVDEMWANAAEAEVLNFGSNIYPSTSTEAAHADNPVATAKVRAMWDSTHLYVLAKVYDTTPNTDASVGTQGCDIDSIDFQISEKNEADQVMSAGTDGVYNGIFNVNINGDVTGWGTVWNEGESLAEGAAKITDYGYCLEIAIPLQSITGTVGTSIGMEFQINDNQDGTGRTAIRQWNCDECHGWENTNYLGIINFVEAPDDTANPATSDMSIFLIFTAAVSVSGGVVIIKKRKMI